MAKKKKRKKSKPLTEEQKRHKKDLYLRRRYGITLKEYNGMLKEQGGGCAICHNPRKTVALSTDHSHKFKYLKVKSWKSKSGNWHAQCRDFPKVCGTATGKSGAIRLVRKQLKRLSVRGVLCFSCNSGLRKYSDSYKRMLAAYKYLRAHYIKMLKLR